MSLLLTRWARLYNLTEAEKALEPAVASLGIRYRVQHPVWNLALFPDFALLDDKVIIEVDDRSHRRKTREDAERTAKLERQGWRVFRCTNEQALSDPYGTVDSLMEQAGLPHRTRRPAAPTEDPHE